MHLPVSVVRASGPVVRTVSGYFRNYGNMAPRVNFNTKHLRKGDPLPPYTGKLRFYNMRYCPFAQRTALALLAKKIDHEVVNVNLFAKPEWLPSKSAFGKVPALEFKENDSIYESLVTVEYLDDVYPERPLLSKDPVKKAFDKILVEATGPIQTMLFKSLRAPETITNENVEAYHKALAFIQEHLEKRGTKFLGGSEPGYADYMNWPWFERILSLGTDDNIKIDENKFKSLSVYLKNMMKDPAVKEYFVEPEVIHKFMESYKKGEEPNYDLLLE